MENTKLSKEELWPEKLPNSFINRAKETVRYLVDEPLLGRIADCGEDNPMKYYIQKSFGLTIDSLDWDFNKEHNLTGLKRYDVIFCFEVLEHVMNPLLFLNKLKEILKEDGTIYLSTPYQRPQCLKAIHHYHEIPDDRILWLFESAGLEVISKTKITIAGNWYDHIKGIRPFLRYFQKTRMYKLKYK